MKTESQDTQTGAENYQFNNQSGKEELIKFTEIEDSPMVVISENNKHFLVLGRDIVSETFDSVKEAIEYHNEKPWKLIFMIAAILARDVDNYNKSEITE